MVDRKKTEKQRARASLSTISGEAGSGTDEAHPLHKPHQLFPLSGPQASTERFCSNKRSVSVADASRDPSETRTTPGRVRTLLFPSATPWVSPPNPPLLACWPSYPTRSLSSNSMRSRLSTSSFPSSGLRSQSTLPLCMSLCTPSLTATNASFPTTASLCTRAMTSRKELTTPLHFWRAKSTITSANTTKRFPSRLVPEAHSRATRTALDLKNMLRQSSVSASRVFTPCSSAFTIFPTAKAIDRYISSRAAEQGDGKIDSRLQGIIEGIFRRCIADGEYRQVCDLFPGMIVRSTNLFSRPLVSP